MEQSARKVEPEIMSSFTGLVAYGISICALGPMKIFNPFQLTVPEILTVPCIIADGPVSVADVMVVPFGISWAE